METMKENKTQINEFGQSVGYTVPGWKPLLPYTDQGTIVGKTCRLEKLNTKK
eukprot:Pgem_evm1s19668